MKTNHLDRYINGYGQISGPTGTGYEFISKDQNEYPKLETEELRMLREDNAAMRKAGMDLAEAAMRVVRDYDGVHRLSVAVSKWMEAISKEGGRGE